MTNSPRDLNDDDLNSVNGGTGVSPPAPGKLSLDGASDLDTVLAVAMAERGASLTAAPDRLAARSEAQTALIEQASQMSAAAQKMQEGAITNLVLGVAQGTMAISGIQAASAAHGKSTDGSLADALKDSLPHSTGVGAIGEGIGAMAAKASEADAKQSGSEAQAQTKEAGVQAADDMMQQMMDVIRDVRDKLTSMEQSRIETTRGIARNI